MLILASAVQPLAKVAIQRQKEAELRRVLREMRDAIDQFHDAAIPPNGGQGRIPSTELKPESEGYPPDLDILVEGVALVNDQTGRKLKFLRRVPDRPDDWDERVGEALVSGQTRHHALGWAERLRRVHDFAGHGAGRHEISRLVRRSP